MNASRPEEQFTRSRALPRLARGHWDGPQRFGYPYREPSLAERVAALESLVTALEGEIESLKLQLPDDSWPVYPR